MQFGKVVKGYDFGRTDRGEVVIVSAEGKSPREVVIAEMPLDLGKDRSKQGYQHYIVSEGCKNVVLSDKEVQLARSIISKRMEARV